MTDVNYASNPHNTRNIVEVEEQNTVQTGKKNSKNFVRSDHTPTTAASSNKRDNL